jgi:hypothetical protein
MKPHSHGVMTGSQPDGSCPQRSCRRHSGVRSPRKRGDSGEASQRPVPSIAIPIWVASVTVATPFSRTSSDLRIRVPPAPSTFQRLQPPCIWKHQGTSASLTFHPSDPSPKKSPISSRLQLPASAGAALVSPLLSLACPVRKTNLRCSSSPAPDRTSGASTGARSCHRLPRALT